jgi:hypothetical protein
MWKIIVLLLLFQGMAPFYEQVCQDLDWKVDQTLLAKIKSANEEKLKELEETIEDAEKNLGEMEVREANLKKSEYLCRIGDKVLSYILNFCIPFLCAIFQILTLLNCETWLCYLLDKEDKKI